MSDDPHEITPIPDEARVPAQNTATIHDNERTRKAVISPDGKVENIIVAANDYTMPGRIIVNAGDAEIGWLYINGVLMPPAQPANQPDA